MKVTPLDLVLPSEADEADGDYAVEGVRPFLMSLKDQ